MENQIKKIKLYILGFIFLIIAANTYGQATLGDNTPNIDADLVLGSQNKGLLLNRVKLTSIKSSAPLKPESMVPGMMLFNTTVNQELQEGVYFWTKDKQWSRLYVKTTPTRDMQFVTFKQTDKTYFLPGPSSKIAIPDLDYDYLAEENGLLFLDYVIYAYIVSGNPKAGNTFCYTVVTDDTNSVVYEGVTAISPFIVLTNQGINSSFGLSSFIFPVKKGKKYKIRMNAHETYALNYTDSDNNTKNYEVKLGDFSYSGQKAHSSLKVTFMSDPSL